MEKSPTQQVYIEKDSLITDMHSEAVEGLVCPICQGIVFAPVECCDCETLFCESEV